jgi:hypothetical protein
MHVLAIPKNTGYCEGVYYGRHWVPHTSAAGERSRPFTSIKVYGSYVIEM